MAPTVLDKNVLALIAKLDELLSQLELSNFTIKTAPISCNTSGYNEIVAAVTGKRIKVFAIILNVAGTVSVKWASAENDLTGAMPLQAREGYTTPAVNPPAFILATVAGEALQLNLSDAIYAYGWVVYWDDDAT